MLRRSARCAASRLMRAVTASTPKAAPSAYALLSSSVAAAPATAASFAITPRRHCSSSTADKKPDAGEEDLVVEPAPEETTKSATSSASETDAEHAVGASEEMGFRTETRQLLNIVACSLYSDKEVFIRELVSNAADALEKRRHLELANPGEYEREAADEQPRIELSCNQRKARFVIRDTGIGMSKEELINNLGTIAGSGSKAFVRELQESGHHDHESTDRIIGQFGVGFYSAFMVAKNVKVYTRSAKKGSKGYLWESDGTGVFKVTECDGVAKGTKIVLDVKETEVSFATPQVVERVLKKYSNFVAYEIALNDAKVNTVDALWMKSKDEVTNEQHIDFYKFISGSYDSPLMRLHYSVDAPLTIRALMYVPQSHSEKYGGGRMDSGVNLYCRRVLIQSKAKNVLPDWLRFIKGAIDCESLALNISREHTQDGATMRRLTSVLTKRVMKWLEEEAKRDRAKYERFIKEFGGFLKEGVCTDQVNKTDIAKLLRFESTATDLDYPLISLNEYVDRMKPNQSHIYYISSPSRDLALASPYFEQYREHGLEVLVLTEHIDDFVMQHLDSYLKHKLQNIEMFDAAHCGAVQHQKKLEGGDKKKDEDVSIKKQLSEDQCKALADFISKRLLGKVNVVKSTSRLSDTPAIIADHEAAQMRKIYRLSGQQAGGPPPKYNFQFNPKHEIVRKVYTLSSSTSSDQVETAGLLVDQLFDNAIIAAGLLDDPRTIVTRLNDIMTRMVKEVPEPTKDQ